MSSYSLIFHTLGGILSRTAGFQVLIFSTLHIFLFATNYFQWVYQWFQKSFWEDSWNVLSISEVFLLNRHLVLRIYQLLSIGHRSRGRPKDFFFGWYYTDVMGRAVLHSLDCSTLPLIRILWCWVLSKAASSNIFWVFGMTQPGIEPHVSCALAHTLPTWPMGYIYIYI